MESSTFLFSVERQHLSFLASHTVIWSMRHSRVNFSDLFSQTFLKQYILEFHCHSEGFFSVQANFLKLIQDAPTPGWRGSAKKFPDPSASRKSCHSSASLKTESFLLTLKMDLEAKVGSCPCLHQWFLFPLVFPIPWPVIDVKTVCCPSCFWGLWLDQIG